MIQAYYDFARNKPVVKLSFGFHQKTGPKARKLINIINLQNNIDNYFYKYYNNSKNNNVNEIRTSDSIPRLRKRELLDSFSGFPAKRKDHRG